VVRAIWAVSLWPVISLAFFSEILKNGHFISVCRFMHSINVIHYDLKLTTCVSFMIAIRAVTSDLSWNFFFPDQWPAETSSCIIFLWWDLLKHTWKGLGSSLPCYNPNFFCVYTARGSVPLLYWWVSTYGKRGSQVIAFLEDLFNLFFFVYGGDGLYIHSI